MFREAYRQRWRHWLNRRIPPARAVQLNQRRIFILPTPRGLAFSVVLLLMLLAGINYQNSLAYGLTFLLLSVFHTAMLHTYRNLSGLMIKAAGVAPVFVGEQARFQLQLESRGKVHEAIACGWPPAPLQVADVPAEGQALLEIPLAANHRGWLRAERLRVESRFPLGLLVAWSWVDLDQAVLVYPQPLPGDLPLAAQAGLEDEDEGQRVVGRGADDFQGLRSFQPGDSRRRLDWKAYSRGQGLLVKDFAQLAGRDLWLDFSSLGGDVEARLSLLCHWVLTLDQRQQAFGLNLPGSRLEPATGAAHREACLKALALFGSASA